MKLLAENQETGRLGIQTIYKILWEDSLALFKKLYLDNLGFNNTFMLFQSLSGMFDVAIFVFLVKHYQMNDRGP